MNMSVCRQGMDSILGDKEILILSQACWLQNAVAALKDGKLVALELHARMLYLVTKLKKIPDDIEDSEAHSAVPKSRHPPPGVKLSASAAGDGRSFMPKVDQKRWRCRSLDLEMADLRLVSCRSKTPKST